MASVYVVMTGSCPDDHEPLVAYAEETVADAAATLLEPPATDDDHLSPFCYVREVPFNPSMQDAYAVMRKAHAE